jgi:hypothetical protein
MALSCHSLWPRDIRCYRYTDRLGTENGDVLEQALDAGEDRFPEAPQKAVAQGLMMAIRAVGSNLAAACVVAVGGDVAGRIGHLLQVAEGIVDVGARVALRVRHRDRLALAVLERGGAWWV